MKTDRNCCWYEPVEVGDDNGYWKSDAKYSTDGAQWSNKLARCSERSHISVPSAGHGDDRPVEGLGQSVEGGVGFILLQSVGQASEDQHAHADCHGQQEQLSVKCLRINFNPVAKFSSLNFQTSQRR